MTDEQAVEQLHFSPDPKIVISTSGDPASAVTMTFVGISGDHESGWTYTVGSNPQDWTKGQDPIPVESNATITVVNNPTDGENSMTHADMLKKQPSGRFTIVPRQRKQLLPGDNGTQATLEVPDAEAGDVFEIVMDDLANLEGAFVSGWTPDNTNENHTTPIPHALGHVPNMIAVWFSNDKLAQYAVLWPWEQSRSGNPVTIHADSDNVYLEIYRKSPLHGMWSPTSTTSGTWTKPNTGYWRIVVS
ncbi:MAG: hypothetical protein AAGF11_10045 [Myxococcota bacterium]